MFGENLNHYFMVEQWIPPHIIEKIKQGPDGWLHLVTQVRVPVEQATTISLGYSADNPPEFYVNGELIREYGTEFEEVESRLQTGR